MDTIDRLQSRIQEARIFLAEDSEALKENPDDAMASMGKSSWERHIADLTQELKLLQRERRKEVFELRLSGPKADNGSIPLNVLSDISKAVHSLLGKSIHKLKYGKEYARGFSQEITDEMDLRLSGMAYGSCQLAFSTDVSPDLAGDSLTQESLKHIFEVLRLESEDEEIHEHLMAIGVGASTRLIDFASVIRKHGLQVDIKWDAPSGKEYLWVGSKQALDQKIYQLNCVDIRTENSFVVRGQVTMLNKRGRVKIECIETSRPYLCTFPASQKGFIESLTLSDIKDFIILEEDFRNSSTNKQTKRYTLLGESQPEDFELAN